MRRADCASSASLTPPTMQLLVPCPLDNPLSGWCIPSQLTAGVPLQGACCQLAPVVSLHQLTSSLDLQVQYYVSQAPYA